MKFETIIISGLIAVLALFVCITAIGSFSNEYSVPYTDEFQPLTNITNDLLSVSSNTKGDVGNFSSSAVSDSGIDAIKVAFKAIVRFDLVLKAIRELIMIPANLLGIDARFTLIFMAILIITVAWTGIYLFMRMQPR